MYFRIPERGRFTCWGMVSFLGIVSLLLSPAMAGEGHSRKNAWQMIKAENKKLIWQLLFNVCVPAISSQFIVLFGFFQQFIGNIRIEYLMKKSIYNLNNQFFIYQNNNVKKSFTIGEAHSHRQDTCPDSRSTYLHKLGNCRYSSV